MQVCQNLKNVTSISDFSQRLSVKDKQVYSGAILLKKHKITYTLSKAYRKFTKRV